MVKSVQYINPKVSSLALYVAYVFGAIGLGVVIKTTWDVCWYITVAPTAIAAYTNCYGLWSFCDDKGTCGKWFAGAILAPHPPERMFGRVGMIMAILIHGAGIIALTFSLPMVGLMALTTSTKRSLANSSGLMFIISGFIVFAVVLNHTITRAQKVAAGEPTDLGSAIFSGFTGAGLEIISGLIIFMGKWIVGMPYRDGGQAKDAFIPVAGGATSGVGSRQTGAGTNLLPAAQMAPLPVQPQGSNFEAYYSEIPTR